MPDEQQNGNGARPTTGFRVVREGSSARVQVYHRRRPTLEGEIALALIERWGMVSAEQDGEDSIGRAKKRAQTPAEVVDKACEIAACAMAQFERRGWLLEVPSPEEAEAQLARADDDAEREPRKRRFF